MTHDLIAARDAGKLAHKSGLPLTANPWLAEPSLDDEWQLRRHESWAAGWEWQDNVAKGWKDWQG